MNPQDDKSDDDEPRPFQFGLRDLFIVNTAAALFFGLAQLVTTDKPIEQVLTSPAVCLVWAGVTILMAFLGAALGREIGAIACALAGGTMWFVIVWAFCTAEPKMAPYVYLPAQIVGMVFTVGPIILLSVRELRRPEPPQEDSPTTQHLLDHKKKFLETQAHREGEGEETGPPSTP